MGPLPYSSNGPTGIYPNVASSQPTTTAYTKVQSISDLFYPNHVLEFEHNPNQNADLHVGKCQDYVQLGLHIIMPGNCTKFLHSANRLNPRIAMCLRSTEELITISWHDGMQTKLNAVLAFANVQVSVQISTVFEFQRVG